MERLEGILKQQEHSSPTAGHAPGMAIGAAPLSPFQTLQQQAGNQAIQQLLRSRFLQPKLAISNPDDPEEREADSVAQTVMRSHAGAPALSPCSCSGGGEMCEKCQQEQSPPTISRSASAPSAPAHVPRIVSDVLRFPGRPLDSATRAFFEPRFGHDFSHVRIHTDAQAAASAKSIEAHAYASGPNIAFASGQYAPDTSAGCTLLAHELTHVLQTPSSPSSSIVRRQGGGNPKARSSSPPPVAGGNILYIGMNNFAPEIAALRNRYQHKPVTITSVTLTGDEAHTHVGRKTYDLTDPAGIHSFATDLNLSAAKTTAIETLLSNASSEDRDDLAHVISVYADVEATGADRMTRVVLSGHSTGDKIYSEGHTGTIYFDALVTLGGIFPKAAGQTRHVMVVACFSGFLRNITDYYQKAFPNMRTSWGWESLCPTGPGAAKALDKWAGTTDKDPASFDAPPSGQANWALGTFQEDSIIDVPEEMRKLRADEAALNDYFNGTQVGDAHSGFVFEYYGRAKRLEGHKGEVTAVDFQYAQTHAGLSFRLRFWKEMASNFWKTYRTKISKGYGAGVTAPDFGRLSRKDALAEIAKFDSVSAAAAADKSEAKRLLKALQDLDPNILIEQWSSVAP